MKLKKHISKLLFCSILLNSVSFYSNAASNNSLSRYETFEGEVIDLGDTDSKDISEIEIFGNTVQDPDNLEDIQSVGELYVNEEGEPILDNQGREQYKFEIESCNDINLMNYKTVKENYRFHNTNEDGSPKEQRWDGWCIITVPIFKDKTYTINKVVTVSNINLYDKNGAFIRLEKMHMVVTNLM